MTGFLLYPEEKHFWSFADYGCVLSVVKQLGAQRVLEFGPGSSTLALIEGGAENIDCCEDDPIWFATYCERLEDRYPHIVTMLPYTWAPEIHVAGADDKRYDLALIDGPFGTERRPAVLRYALDRCDAALVCCEDFYGPGLRQHIDKIAREAGRPVEYMETGPLSGSFALITC